MLSLTALRPCSSPPSVYTFSLPPTLKEKGRGKKHLSEQSGEIQPLSPIPVPEKDETGLLAWPATTFLTLHRQETKSLEAEGRVREGGSSDQERRKHTGLMGGGGEEQPIYPDL